MILKASQRGGARQLAAHLLNTEDNEHCELHDIRGFMSDDLHGALVEAHAISKATRCKQFMFSISLSPPQHEDVPIEAFEYALSRIEEEHGLKGQPRAVVFHEKEGRRHAHAVYNRIDIQEMKAINLPHYKYKLRDISRELFIKNEWKIPQGLMNSQDRNPTNYSFEQYQQAKRARKDPKAIKAAFQESWSISDGCTSFKHALHERGFYLAKGDRRGFVALDFKGEVYAVAKWAGTKTKAVKEKLGKPDQLPSVDETKAIIAHDMTPKLKVFLADIDKAYGEKSSHLQEKRTQMVANHRRGRTLLDSVIEQRHASETLARSKRLRRGLRGLWDRITGTYQRLRKQNEQELHASQKRDATERQSLITKQLEERQRFQTFIRAERAKNTSEIMYLHRDIRDHEQNEATQQQHTLDHEM